MTAQNSRSDALSRIRTAAYWVTTMPVAAEMVKGGMWDLTREPFAVETFDQLGYPRYFLTIQGICKLPMAAVLLAPGMPRLKEWAYAGSLAVYLGGAASHLANGNPRKFAMPAMVLAGFAAASWAMRPTARRDPSPDPIGATWRIGRGILHALLSAPPPEAARP
ncbi:DoxX family protein [Nocardia sp. NPDC050408]|uniref:DoxX family protein n=1 Tax=Nocardia sp. NPDC050408 TaxID=3364319 RepID=UPI0037A3BB6B